MPQNALSARPLLRPEKITAQRVPSEASYRVLYGFAGGSDGANPPAGLVNVNGVLFGTTRTGGASKCYSGAGCGTIFSISKTGPEKMLYRFAGRPDGALPYAGLLKVNGTLYGTTSNGGLGAGTVYSISTTGSENVLHSFAGGSDGAYPEASLVDVNGTLYGTTVSGGGNGCNLGCGTVYSISTTGSEKVLHRFAGGSNGAYPEASLVDVNGTLYGTTFSGGTYCRDYCGTVFSITTAGTEHVLHSFGSGDDGAGPEAGLIDVNGTLYGTTYRGGVPCSTPGCGTVYSISTTGSEKVLYSFTGHNDGRLPEASLINVNGTLYGTTTNGGSHGYGTVFALRP
jgi:uncharacterized repeat protein (TIGR03803 family)